MTTLLLLTIILATLVSEDLTCIGSGLLVAAGQLDLATALAGCVAGIYLGDLGLWALGRFAGQTFLRRFHGPRLDQVRLWLDERGGQAVLLARFVPGSRLPLYLLAGWLGRQPVRFALWTLLAVLLWVPLVVVPIAWLGEPAAEVSRWLLGPGWLLLASIVVVVPLRTRRGRERLIALVSRLWRWEFWPAWIFYLPLVPWLAWLSLRHRGLTVWTAANPGIEAGGVVGESKAEILARLPCEYVIPFALVPQGEHPDRLAWLRGEVEARAWAFPLILKPDAGQRGVGVKRVNDWHEAEAYLVQQPAPVLVQPYHPGPFEAGIFYHRQPGQDRGRILAITDKVFPVLTGDGRSTVEELIWRHPRHRMQAHTFLARHDRQRARVLGEGEQLVLTLAGNHSQGTLFRDGGHLWSPRLEEVIDQVARSFAGFHVGRFDVRYTSEEAFRAGEDLAIVELNGVTAEATSLYDPERSLGSAYALLFRQWALVYQIGASNRDRGIRPVSVRELARLVWCHYRDRRGNLQAD